MGLRSEGLDDDLGNVVRGGRERQKMLGFVEESQIYERFFFFIY